MDFTFFWHGDLSQWSKSPFRDNHGIEYNCCEQYMMAHKAKLFGDFETYRHIMDSDSPRDQKALGRLVKNFNERIWDVYSTMIVYDANMFKFKQNKSHYESLMNTGNTILVEASPYDAIWGIKLREDDIRCKTMSTWLGQNRLGFVLTKVRDDLRRLVD